MAFANHIRVFGMICLCAMLTGCQAGLRKITKYETIQVSPQHDAELARQKNDIAVKHLHQGKLDKAEAELQAALIADVDFGPAHNNLGYVYFLQEKYYLAAWEFEYALKLIPESAESLNNLGLVYDVVGRYPQAQEYFESAVQLDPENPEYLSNLASVRLRRGERSLDLANLFREVALRDDRPDWRDWAQEQLHSSLLNFNLDLDHEPSAESPPGKLPADVPFKSNPDSPLTDTEETLPPPMDPFPPSLPPIRPQVPVTPKALQ